MSWSALNAPNRAGVLVKALCGVYHLPQQGHAGAVTRLLNDRELAARLATAAHRYAIGPFPIL